MFARVSCSKQILTTVPKNVRICLDILTINSTAALLEFLDEVVPGMTPDKACNEPWMAVLKVFLCLPPRVACEENCHRIGSHKVGPKKKSAT